MGIEYIKPKIERKLSEDEAFDVFEALLEDPENRFLRENPLNKAVVEDETISIFDRLDWARKKIEEREVTLTHMVVLNSIESFKPLEVSRENVYLMLEELYEHKVKVGEGRHSEVLLNSEELQYAPPEVCYKIGKPRDDRLYRNSLEQEAEMQNRFYQEATEDVDSIVGVPPPYYYVQGSKIEVLVMEKLAAHSVRDFLVGKAQLPEDVDIEGVCGELASFVSKMHEKGIHHRDIHEGNILIPDKREEGKPQVYIIDYGSSGFVAPDEDPTQIEYRGKIYTTGEDFERLQEVEGSLRSLVKRKTEAAT